MNTTSFKRTPAQWQAERAAQFASRLTSTQKMFRQASASLTVSAQPFPDATRLLDGNFISNEALEKLKKEWPEGHDILTNRGFDAYNKAVTKAQGQTIDIKGEYKALTGRQKEPLPPTGAKGVRGGRPYGKALREAGFDKVIDISSRFASGEITAFPKKPGFYAIREKDITVDKGKNESIKTTTLVYARLGDGSLVQVDKSAKVFTRAPVFVPEVKRGGMVVRAGDSGSADYRELIARTAKPEGGTPEYKKWLEKGHPGWKLVTRGEYEEHYAGPFLGLTHEQKEGARKLSKEKGMPYKQALGLVSASGYYDPEAIVKLPGPSGYGIFDPSTGKRVWGKLTPEVTSAIKKLKPFEKVAGVYDLAALFSKGDTQQRIAAGVVFGQDFEDYVKAQKDWEADLKKNFPDLYKTYKEQGIEVYSHEVRNIEERLRQQEQALARLKDYEMGNGLRPGYSPKYDVFTYLRDHPGDWQTLQQAGYDEITAKEWNKAIQVIPKDCWAPDGQLDMVKVQQAVWHGTDRKAFEILDIDLSAVVPQGATATEISEWLSEGGKVKWGNPQYEQIFRAATRVDVDVFAYGPPHITTPEKTRKWWESLSKNDQEKVASAYRTELKEIEAFPTELAGKTVELAGRLPEPVRVPVTGAATVMATGLTTGLVGAGIGSVVPGLGTGAGFLVGLGAGMAGGTVLVAIPYIDPKSGKQFTQLLDTGSGKVIKSQEDFANALSDQPHLQQVPGDFARAAYDIFTSVGAVIPLAMLGATTHVRSGDLDKTVGEMARIGGGVLIFPVILAVEAVADPWRGIPYAAGAAATFFISPKALLKMAKDIGVRIDPRGLAAQDMALEMNISRIATDPLMTPAKLRAFTEAFEKQVLKAAKTGHDLPIFDIEGRQIGHVSPLQRFLPDTVYSVGQDIAAIERGTKAGKLTVGETVVKPGESAHAEFLWTSPQAAFEFAKGEGLVTAYRVTPKDIIWRGDDGIWRQGDTALPKGQQRLLQGIWEIKDNSARRDALYKANEEGKLPQGLLLGPFKGYSTPIKFEYELAFTKGTDLYTTPQPWYGKYVKDAGTGTTYTIDPISGKTMPVYWFATKSALKGGKGVPALNTTYTAKAYSVFVQSLRNLTRLGRRPIKVSVLEEGRAFSPIKSYFSALEVKTIQDVAKGFLKRETKLEPGEARQMLTQEQQGARLMLELGKDRPAFEKQFDLKAVESLEDFKPETLKEIEGILKDYDAHIYGSFVEYLYGLTKKAGDLDLAAKNYKGLAEKLADVIAKDEKIKAKVELVPKGQIGKTGSIIPSIAKVGDIGSVVKLAEHLQEHSYGLRGGEPMIANGIKVEPLGNQILNRVDALMRSGLIEDAGRITRFKDIAKLEADVMYLVEQMKKRGELDRAKATQDALEGFLQNYATRRYNELVTEKVINDNLGEIKTWQKEINALAQDKAEARGEKTPSSEDMARASEEVLAKKLKERGINRAEAEELLKRGREELGVTEEPYIFNLRRALAAMAGEAAAREMQQRQEKELSYRYGREKARAEGKPEPEPKTREAGYGPAEGLYAPYGPERPYGPEKPYGPERPYGTEKPIKTYRPLPLEGEYKGLKGTKPVRTSRGTAAQKKEARRQEFAGATTWKQGFGWWAVKEPYAGKEDAMFFKGTPPPNAKIIKGGAKSAFRSIQQISGRSPEDLKIDLGFQDILISKAKKKPGAAGAIRFRPDPGQKTTGDITVTSTPRGKPRVTRGTVDESTPVMPPLGQTKMSRGIAEMIGSVDAKIVDGKPKIKVKRL